MNDRLDKLRESDAPERRAVAVADFEIRKDGDSLSLDGYASVFDAPYEMFGGPTRGGWTEVVDRKAFDKTLREKPDLHLLINHEGMPLARTKSGTLKLSTDSKGLRVKAPSLDRRDPDVQRLEVKMDRGDMDEMSFAFHTIRDSFDDDSGERRLLELSLNKGDVSIVNFGANPATSAKLRGLLTQLAGYDVADALAEVRNLTEDELREAYHLIGRLVREVVPAGRRTLSVPEAMQLMGAAPPEVRAAIPSHSTATTEENPGGNAIMTAAATTGDYRAVCAWVDSDGDPDQRGSYKFPHHVRPGGAASLPLVRNGLSRLPQSSIPEADRPGVERHLRRHLEDAED